MSTDVFIGYRFEDPDQTVVKNLKTKLLEKKLSVFALAPGDDFNIKISEAARNSTVCIFVLSKLWAESWYCFRELITAQRYAYHTVCPVILDNLQEIKSIVESAKDQHYSKLGEKLTDIEKDTVMGAYNWLTDKQGMKVRANDESDIKEAAKLIKEMVDTRKRKNSTPRPTYTLAKGQDPFKICSREFGNGFLYTKMTYNGSFLTAEVAHNLPVGAELQYSDEPEFVLAPKDDPYRICQRAFGDGMLYKKLEYNGNLLTKKTARNLPDGARLVFKG